MMYSKTLSVGYFPPILAVIWLINLAQDLATLVWLTLLRAMPSTSKFGIITLLGFIALIFAAVFSFATYFLLSRLNTASSGDLSGALVVIIGLFVLVLAAGFVMLTLINRFGRVAQ